MIPQWYELLYDNGKETQTIYSSEELQDLRHLRENLYSICFIPKYRLHIDKWENPINPKMVETIE